MMCALPILSESGIYNRNDVQRLGDAGVHAILVGESIITSKDVGEKIRELLEIKNQKSKIKM